MKNKFCCFEDLFLRLSTYVSGIDLIAVMVPFHIVGLLPKSAKALANWQLPARYMAVLPKNELSDQLIKYMNRQVIDCPSSICAGNLLGIYYLPVGFDLKNPLLFCYRECTSFAVLTTKKLITISVDLKYRTKRSKYGKPACRV